MITEQQLATLENGEMITLPDTKICIRRTITRKDLKNGTVAFEHSFYASADRKGCTGGFVSRSIEATLKYQNFHQGK